MEKKKCEICGKIIEGYTQRHVSFLMLQHQITHRLENNKLKGGKDGVQEKKGN